VRDVGLAVVADDDIEPALATVLADAEAALVGERDADRVLVIARIRRHWPDLVRGLQIAYGDRALAVATEAVALAVQRFGDRSCDLRVLDLRRMVEPDWFQQPSAVGYACYAERFGGTLGGVAEHVGYLSELGVTYVHLMPLLAPRPAPNDGGYAVQDYRQVRTDLGTMDDLRALATTLRGRGIALTLDLVVNHVAREHEWAARARAGEKRYREYFHVFDDRGLPDAYEATLPEVFPDFAPGSFTWDDEINGWVWTTFNDWQWDLNWHNPDVFVEMADVVLYLANAGVECLRLDAIAFLWKRMGTSSQNQPEVHAITQALRAVAKIMAPALIFKAEAIVGPEDLVPYLGVGEHAGKVSDLTYHNSLMVQTWSALAASDARLASAALRRFVAKPATTAWATYVRCHDDIGWAIDDRDAAAVGWDGYAHRAFLSEWYAGTYPGSDARGLVFQHNPDTGDRRISGTAASLAGLEAALESGDVGHVDIAIRRLMLAHAVALGWGGMPLLYMGDELALRNDYSYASDLDHAGDNRWVHRPVMPWAVAERRREAGTLEHRVWHELRHLIATRASLPAMHAATESVVLDPVNPTVLGWLRPHPRQPVVALHNVTGSVQHWPRSAVPLEGHLMDTIGGLVVPPDGRTVELEPYAAAWLRQA
jgi:amylosucrase